MTFALAARCAATGAFGVAVTSSSICVASRCAFVRHGVGAVLSQNVTDPRIGPRALDVLAEGNGASETLARLVAATPNIQWRQVAVVDRAGRTSHHSGAKTLGVHASATGDGCVALGNLLATQAVPGAMVDAFATMAGDLAERLVGALEAGLAAGGEASPVRSAGLLVTDRPGSAVTWPAVDLRVDWSETPIAALRTLWLDYAPQKDAYLTRALDPDAAPSYGVAGDP